MARRRSLPTISEEVQFRDMGSFRFRRPLRTSSTSSLTVSARRRRRTTSNNNALESSSSSSKDDSSTTTINNSFDFSNLAPSDRERIARLEAFLDKVGLRRKQQKQQQNLSKSPASNNNKNMYPSSSSIHAIPDYIDPMDVLSDNLNFSLTNLFDPEDYESSSGAPLSLENSDSTGSSSQEESFFCAWRVEEPDKSSNSSLPAHQECRPNNIALMGNNNNQQQQQQQEEQDIYFEVEKGTYEKLRGAKEMLAALEAGFVTETLCVACSCRMFCIANAALVLCPECRMISPIVMSNTSSSQNNENTTTTTTTSVDVGARRYHGVGLGLRA